MMMDRASLNRYCVQYDLFAYRRIPLRLDTGNVDMTSSSSQTQLSIHRRLKPTRLSNNSRKPPAVITSPFRIRKLDNRLPACSTHRPPSNEQSKDVSDWYVHSGIANVRSSTSCPSSVDDFATVARFTANVLIRFISRNDSANFRRHSASSRLIVKFNVKCRRPCSPETAASTRAGRWLISNRCSDTYAWLIFYDIIKRLISKCNKHLFE
jgi:hypothetical protein